MSDHQTKGPPMKTIVNADGDTAQLQSLDIDGFPVSHGLYIDALPAAAIRGGQDVEVGLHGIANGGRWLEVPPLPAVVGPVVTIASGQAHAAGSSRQPLQPTAWRHVTDPVADRLAMVVYLVLGGIAWEFIERFWPVVEYLASLAL